MRTASGGLAGDSNRKAGIHIAIDPGINNHY